MGESIASSQPRAGGTIIASKTVAAAERAEFERAYRDLAQFVSPVTAATLEATAEEGEPGWDKDRRWGHNRATRWSRRLWVWTIVFMVLAVLVGPFRWLSQAAAWLDDHVIDRTVDVIGAIPRWVSAAPRHLQEGVVPSYALMMWAGLLLCLLAVTSMVW